MKLDRATVCLPIKNRQVSHAFYTALGFATVGELGNDGLLEPLQFEISVGLRVMLIPTRGFGWVIGDRKRSPRNTHECLVVIGLRQLRSRDAQVALVLACQRGTDEGVGFSPACVQFIRRPSVWWCFDGGTSRPGQSVLTCARGDTDRWILHPE